MKAERSHAGFALMEPAFLRSLGQDAWSVRDADASDSSHAPGAGWRTWVAERWSSLTAPASSPGAGGPAPRR